MSDRRDAAPRGLRVPLVLVVATLVVGGSALAGACGDDETCPTAENAGGGGGAGGGEAEPEECEPEDDGSDSVA